MLIRRRTGYFAFGDHVRTCFYPSPRLLKQAASMGLISRLAGAAVRCRPVACASLVWKANPLYAPADEKSTRSDFRQLLQLLRFGTDKTDPPVMATC